MKALTYLIKLHEPVLVAKAQSDEPNSASTELFIPGSAVRGALIGRYLDQPENRQADLMKDEKARLLFFSDRVLFLNAYFAYVPTQTRLLPRPFSWFVEKDERRETSAMIHDFVVRFGAQMTSPKSPKTGEFVYQPEETVYLAKPEIRTMVHNTSEDRNRKGEGLSNVFRYDALAAGQYFAGAILINDEQALPEVEKLFVEKLFKDSHFRLGGTRTGGYGWVSFESFKLVESWQEYETHGSPSSEYIIITLLSDTIVRNKHGHCSGDFDEGLALVLTAVDKQPPKTLRHTQAFQGHKLIGGFNRKWGLPLPQALAIAAGSVFVYEKGQIDEGALQKLVENGVGERRNEGFGRIALNWYHAERWRQGKFSIQTSHASEPPPELRTGSPSYILAQRMAESRLRKLLDQQLISIVGDVNWKENKSLEHLTPSQLSQMRQAARRAVYEKSLNKIAVQINHINLLSSAKERWMRVRLGDEYLLNWIEIWARLSDDDFKLRFALTGDLPEVAGASAVLTKELRQEYCARVIDYVMKKAIKELQKREESDESKV